MSTYSLFCGDIKITEVKFNAEIPQALSKNEQDSIKDLAKETRDYKDFHEWLGFGFMTIKLNPTTNYLSNYKKIIN